MKGKVIFIGAGPGDPDLVTVKGRWCVQIQQILQTDCCSIWFGHPL